MSDDRFHTNTERFIYEVSIRSCIWNTHCLEYKIRNKRRIAWEEICKIFFSNFDSKTNDKKEYLCQILQKKWKSIRDTYVRDLRNTKRKKYVHAKLLSFLGDVVKLHKPIEAKPGTDDGADYYDEEQEENDEEDEDDDDKEMIFRNNDLFYSRDTNQSSNSNYSKHLEVQTPAEPKIPSPLPAQCSNTSKSIVDQGDDDEDRLFLLSLLNDLKKVPDYNKLEAKSELLLVLNRWKKSKPQI